jgi:hypothetical protein
MRSLAILSILFAGCGGVGVMSAPDGGGLQPSPSVSVPDGAASASDGASDDLGPAPSNHPPAADPCRNATLGDGLYCGGPLGGAADTLYSCAGGATASSQPCAMGCHVAPPGVADYCNDDNAYHLPWACNASYVCTQGNAGDICGGGTGDHTGTQQYAWDFGLPRHTPVLASRGGTVTVSANVTSSGHACYDGCTQPFGTSAFWTCCNGCINTANHVNVQHVDGTVATYFHLDVATVTVGQKVKAGDLLGYSGTSGCSSGPHLHFQVMGNCPTGYCQSIATSFAEAGVPACGDQVTSQNACP